MDGTRFDRISRLFAQNRLSRRQALTATAAGVAAGVAGVQRAGFAQDATPHATPETGFTGEKTTYLFVQSFQSGTLTKNEADERHTLTLNQGLGQTIYFGDRPSREVGVTLTEQFLQGLGFTDDNPPNAALIVEMGDGETDLAVLELFAPTYDAATHTATYQVSGLEAWEDNVDLGLQQTPTDLAGMPPDFTAAHLLIDDCLNATVDCYAAGADSGSWIGSIDNQPFCYNYGICMPCEPYGNVQPDKCSTIHYWGGKCKDQFQYCKDHGCYADFGGAIFMGC